MSSDFHLWRWPSFRCSSQKTLTDQKRRKNIHMKQLVISHLCIFTLNENSVLTKCLCATWTVMMAIFNICNISFHGLRPLALYFSQGFMKKYLSLRLKSSTTFDSTPWVPWLHLQLPFILLSSELTRSSESSIILKCRAEHDLVSVEAVLVAFVFTVFVKALIHLVLEGQVQSFQSFWCLSHSLLHSPTDIFLSSVLTSQITN